MPTRNRGQSSISRADEVEYFLFLQGIPPQCRWQDLKDVLRRIPPDGHIRQAHTDNENGIGWGQISILHKGKAFNSYDHLVINGWRGHNIRLTLVTKDQDDKETLRRLRGPEDSRVHAFQRYNPAGQLYSPQSLPLLSSPLPSSPLPSIVTQHFAHGSSYSNLGQPSAPSVHQATMPLVAPRLIAVQQPLTSGYDYYQSSPLCGPQRIIQQSPPTYTTSQHQLCAPVSRGNNKTSSSSAARRNPSNKSDDGSRTVHIYNLPYDVKELEIKAYLTTAGLVDRCLVKEDRRRTPKHKMMAVAAFCSSEDAQNAIDRFDGKLWKGLEITVQRGSRTPASSDARSNTRKDPLSSHVGDYRREKGEGPLVVNGSGPSILNQSSRVDSEEESTSEDGRYGHHLRLRLMTDISRAIT